MTVKSFSLTILGAALIASIPTLASASGPQSPCQLNCPRAMERCERPAPPAPHITAEQMAKFKELRDERRAALAPLRQQLTQKRMELRALSPNPNMKPEELKALVAEIMELRGKIKAVNSDYRDKLKKAGLPEWLGKKSAFRPHAPRHGNEYHGNPMGRAHGCWR